MNHSRTGLSPLLGLLLLAAVAGAEAVVKYHSLTIRGKVVDDETGLPVVTFVQQSGQSSPDDPNKIVWGGGLSTTDSPRKDGAFNDNLGWEDGKKAWSRIIADNYLPEPIRATPFSTEEGRVEGLVVRLKRGRKVEGRVVDSAGKAVAGARVMLFGAHPLTITDGDACSELDHRPTRGVSRAMTDADGKFSLTGAGGDMNQVVVSTPACNLWPTPIPAPGEEFVIRLPQTGNLSLRYDVDADDAEADFTLQLSPSPFKNLTSFQHVKVANKSRQRVSGLIPGKYDLAKIRTVDLGAGGKRTLFCDRRTIDVKAGETIASDFARDHGARVSVEVGGLADLEVPGAAVLIQSGDERVQKKPRYSFTDLIDAFATDVKGRGRTPKLAPGTYTIVAEGYLPPAKKGFRGGIGPDYRSISIVKVEDGIDQTVRIEMPKPKTPK